MQHHLPRLGGASVEITKLRGSQNKTDWETEREREVSLRKEQTNCKLFFLQKILFRYFESILLIFGVYGSVVCSFDITWNVDVLGLVLQWKKTEIIHLFKIIVPSVFVSNRHCPYLIFLSNCF